MTENTDTSRHKGGLFHVRAYGRTELALLYSPHLSPGRAWTKLQAWLARIPGMQEQLAALGYRRDCRTFTPAQVEQIVRWLGEPM